ncbi:MAG: hypothetical protein ABFS38_16240 [Bacteroidota bacterium]
MMKYFTYYIVMAIFCLSFSLQGQDVKISIDRPDQVNAGEEFSVTVTINKGSLTDYSRFSQDLPLGLSATNVSSPNADFSFDNQRIRIIWLKLPDSDEVKVTYNVMVDKRLKGSFNLGGVFAYVVEDERKFLNFPQSGEISIVPSPSMAPALIVDIKNFKGGESPGPVSTEQEPFAMAIRQKPVLLSSGEYLIRLIINTPFASKYLKIEESIPSGYVFEEVNSHNGIASLAPSTVKFIWMSIPKEPLFEVEYKLIPLANQSQGNMVLEGLLTHTSGNENQEDVVKELDVDFNDLDQDQKMNLLLTGLIPSSAGKSGGKVVQETTLPKPDPKPPVDKPAGPSDKTIVNTTVLTAGTGVYFRVQLTANQSAFDARSHYRKAGLDREVMVEQHEGWYKYTVGSFQTHEQAVTYRDRIEGLSFIEGSFVVAYRDGRRVLINSSRR